MKREPMVHRMFCLFTATITLLGAWGAVARAEPYIVRDGTPTAEILIAAEASPTCRLAADELQALLKKISGARLEIGTEPTAAAPVKIYVGRSEFTDRLGLSVEGLVVDGYRIVTGADWMALIGDDTMFEPREPYARSRNDRARAVEEWDKMTGGWWPCPGLSAFKEYSPALGIWAGSGRGSLNAVYGFLRSLGARWYFPGDFGECLPALPTIALPDVNETVEPDFTERTFGFSGYTLGQCSRERALWYLRLGLRWQKGNLPGGHGINYAIHRDKPRSMHPEWYLLTHGRRDTVSRGGKPCLSTRGLMRSNIDFVRTYFDVYDGDMVSVMPTDAYGPFCECALCKGRNTPDRGRDGVMSDYVWSYVDGVARAALATHPDKLISCGAYAGYRLPPAGIEKLSPNIRVRISGHHAAASDPEAHRKAMELRRAWVAKLSGTRPLRTHDNYSHAGGAQAGVPVYFPHGIAQDLRSLKEICSGEYIEVNAPSPPDSDPPINLAVNHLNIYTTARFWWDADQDVEALLEEYYDKFYGPAAAAMKAFVEYGEAHWQEMNRDLAPIERALELLAAARAAAGEDTIHARRVALVDEFVTPMRHLATRLQTHDKKVLHAVLPHIGNPAETDLQLDGRVDERVWQRFKGHRLKDAASGEAAVPETWIKPLWVFGGKSGLHLAIRCEEPDMTGLVVAGEAADDGRIMKGDSIEVLIETQTHSYYQLVFNPDGTLLDADWEGGVDTTWTSGAEVHTHRGDGYWSAELRIPLMGRGGEGAEGLVGRVPRGAAPWYFNVMRRRPRDGATQRLVLAPLGEGEFHDLSTFGALHLPR